MDGIDIAGTRGLAMSLCFEQGRHMAATEFRLHTVTHRRALRRRWLPARLGVREMQSSGGLKRSVLALSDREVQELIAEPWALSVNRVPELSFTLFGSSELTVPGLGAWQVAAGETDGRGSVSPTTLRYRNRMLTARVWRDRTRYRWELRDGDVPIAEGSDRRRRATRSWYEVLYLAAAVVTGIGKLELKPRLLRNGQS